MRRAGLVGAALFASACATGAGDAFESAQAALRCHDLAGALQRLDAIPVAHARYPEARATAVAVERDMRRCHELVVEALLLRAEWRDHEALAALQRARAAWPALPSLDVLIAATEQRLRMFAGRVPAAVGGAEAAVPLAESAPLPGTVVAVQQLPHAPPAAAESPSGSADEIAAALMAVEVRLGRGELEGAVGELLALADLHPQEPRVRARLVRLLHQRALLHYGQGLLLAAIADWRRVLEVDPGHTLARQLLVAVEEESRRR